MMRPPRALHRAVVGALLLIGSGGAARAQPPAPEPAEAPAPDRADGLFRDGNAAYDRGDFAAAADAYAAAFALKPTHDIAANLAAAELKLGRHADAANHFAFALRNYPPSGEPTKRDGLQRRYDEARAHAGALVIATEEGTTIRVDGRDVGTAPLLGVLHVTPGEHAIEARKGDRRATATATVAAGESAPVELVLAATAAEPGGVAPGGSRSPMPPPDDGTDDGWPLWPALVGIGVGATAVGIGVGLVAASASAGDDADALRRELEGTSCAAASDPRCAELADAASDESSLGSAGVGLLVGGSAVAVGSVVYAVVVASVRGSGGTEQGTARRGARVRGARVTPVVGPGGVGATFGGVF